MRFSLDWIRDHVDLPADLAPEAIAGRLTAAGLAVEDLEPQDDGDVVLEVDITTNRPDCMNHHGLARELSVLYGVDLDEVGLRGVDPVEGGAGAAAEESAADAVGVAITDEGCERFSATVVRGITVGPSPERVRRRLERIGVRAINNVVDVTNYLLWDCGQPMHAYDLDRLVGARLEARAARAGETLVTLDGELRELAAGELVIADAERPVGLAGVMGGRDSEVSDATVDVVIEAAHFRPTPVRFGARAHTLHTDASHRFERGADPGLCAAAARLAAEMIQRLAGGVVQRGVVDVHAETGAAQPVRVAHDALERFGGIPVAPAEVERILGGLGFEVEADGDGDGDGAGVGWRVAAPSWRRYDFADAYPADVYEEVLRIVGFDALPATLPAIGDPDAPESAEHRLRRRVQDHLAAVGLAETVCWAFLDRDRATAFPSLLGDAPALAVANPLSELYTVMRRSLLPDLVEAARYNLRRGAASVRLFEVGHVFAPPDTDHPLAISGTPVREIETVGLVLGGTLGSPWQRPVTFDFFDLKGIVESLAAACGSRLGARPATLPMLVEGAAAELVRPDDDATVVGFIGQLRAADDPVTLFVAELATAGLRSVDEELRVAPPPRLPGIAVDATITHPASTAWRELAAAVEAAETRDLVGFSLESRYAGEGVPAGAVNTTIRFRYHGGDRALTQDEVNDRHARLVTRLEQQIGVSNR